MRPVTKSRIFRLLRLPVIIYVLLCGIVGVFQRRIIYFPFSFPNKTDGTPPSVAREIARQDKVITAIAAVLNNIDDAEWNPMTLTGGPLEHPADPVDVEDAGQRARTVAGAPASTCVRCHSSSMSRHQRR